MDVTTRSYDAARTGANRRETTFTTHNMSNNVMVKLFSLETNDDPCIEAQPQYVAGLTMNDGTVHDVIYVCTMANQVWAFDANSGKQIWAKPTLLAPPVKPKLKPSPGFPNATDIDLWGINKHWAILSTPVIDPDKKHMYVVLWTSKDGDPANAEHQLHKIDIVTGAPVAHRLIDASADSQVAARKPVPKFVSPRQKQKPPRFRDPREGRGGRDG